MDAEDRIHKLRSGEYDVILHLVGAPFEERMKKRKDEELRIKEEILRTVHVTRDGSPRKISTTVKGNKEYYYTKVEGRPILDNTYEGLIDKLYYHYGGDELRHGHSFSYYFGIYVKEYAESHPGNEKTARNARGDYKRFVNEELASMDVRDITPKYLEAYSRKLIVSLSLKVSAFKNFKSLLNNVFSTAISDMIIYHNPAKGMDNKSCYALCDQSGRSEMDYDDELVSDGEMEKIEAEVARRREFHKRYGEDAFYFYDVMVMLHSEIGCRPGELSALRVRDVKEEDLHIHAMIDADDDYQQFTKNEKGESRGGRLFPLTPKMKDLLDELQARKEKCGIESEYLFCYADGRCVLPTSYEEYVHNVFHRVGIRGKTSYAFRRTVNSRLEEAGFTPSERAYLLGHTPDTNVKHYTNPRKNATLAKFRNTFCVRSTFGLPENVIEFKSKKPKNREFSGF